MTIEEAIVQVKETAIAIANTWSHLSEFSVPSPGVAFEVIATKRECKSKFRSFDLLLGGQLSDLQRCLIRDYGVSGERLFTLEHIKLGRKKIASSYPQRKPFDVDLLNQLFMVNEFVLRYVAVGEKSRLGESVLQCYPSCGIPCGWQDDGGVLFLYHPDLH